MRGLSLFALALALTAGPAAAKDYVVGDRSLSLTPPSGYCPLSGTNPDEADLLDGLRKANAAQNDMLMAFADCAELTERREGSRKAFSRHGHYLLPLSGGQVRPMAGTDRGKILGDVEEMVPKLDRAALKDAVDTALTNAAGRPLARVKQGVVARDENAVYIGNVGVFEVDGVETAVAGITGLTVANSLLVSTNLYRPFVDDTSFDTLVTEQRAIARQIVLANPDAPPSSTTGETVSAKAERHRTIAFAALILAAVVGLATLLASRANSR